MPDSFLSNIRSFCRLVLLFTWLLLVLPLQVLITLLNPLHPLRQKLIRCIFKGTCFALGIRIILSGEKSLHTPCLFISNHVSYLDILVLGASLNAAFVSKEEVKKWPIFGLYAQLQGAIFIKREKITLLQQKSVILKRLQEGGSLILFPEGTTHNGIHVLPFKSSLLKSVEEESLFSTLKIQPVSLAYTHLSGFPLGRKERLACAWFGDLSLLPHVRSLIALGPLLVHVKFHEPLITQKNFSRKEIASYCHDHISKGIAKTFQAP